MPQWDCATCSDFYKRERGCTDKPLVPVVLDGKELERCPRRPMLDDPAFYNAMLKAYSWYKRGHFPDTGTYLDQAAAYTEMLDIFELAISEAKAVLEKENERKSKRGAL